MLKRVRVHIRLLAGLTMLAISSGAAQTPQAASRNAGTRARAAGKPATAGAGKLAAIAPLIDQAIRES